MNTSTLEQQLAQLSADIQKKAILRNAAQNKLQAVQTKKGVVENAFNIKTTDIQANLATRENSFIVLSQKWTKIVADVEAHVQDLVNEITSLEARKSQLESTITAVAAITQ